jgi:predicted lipoprotein with Yx(FWY)xxD motif
MPLRRNSALMLAALPLIAIGLAACGSSSNSSSTNSSTTNGSTAASKAGGATVTTMSISGVGTALVDSKGNALYTNNKDSGSTVACTGSCAGIWVPLAAPSSGQPTSGDAAVQAKLAVVMTPDGTSQVTFGGKPLYTFVQDSPGQATGNGVTDSFSGTSFTWTVASTGKVSASSGSGAAGTSSAAGASTATTGRSASSSGSGYGY